MIRAVNSNKQGKMTEAQKLKFQFQPASQNDIEKVERLVDEGWELDEAINQVNDSYLEMDQE